MNKYIGCVNSFPGEYIDKDGNVVDSNSPDRVAWRIKYPDAIRACKEAGHKTVNTSTAYGYHTYSCPECGIWWDMDSGD